jgi:hypothetical protein
VRSSRTRNAAAVALLCVAAGVGLWLLTRSSGTERAQQSPTGTLTDYSARFAGYKAAAEPNGNLQKVRWPAFVVAAGPEVKRLYEFQITHGELMRYMPCFCGCGQNAGHMSNRDCYVRRINADGTVVLDGMAPT